MSASIDTLRRERPRNRWAQASLWAFAVATVWAWSSDAFDLRSLGSERSARNLARFATEIRPYPLQDAEWSFGVAAAWARETTEGRVAGALRDTLALGIAASVLAALAALLASGMAARTLATAEPFLPASRPPGIARRMGFASLVWGTRGLFVFARAIPEYVWAFLLLILLGPGAGPAVLALAIHNTGILGRLFAELTENADPRAAEALRAAGAGRTAIALHALWPASLGRGLLLFFYRAETCIREATILGLLGFSGIGYYVLQAQAAIRWDEMLLWTLCGSALVGLFDAISAVARRAIRRAPAASAESTMRSGESPATV